MASRSSGDTLARAAFAFVLTMGVVNLFADMTYEGGASINGPFLRSLGASATAVSILAGLGEFLGYSLRSISGYVADRTGWYWRITFVGYAVNLLAVPAMSMTGRFRSAAALIVLERVGRALRKPTVEAMLSYSADTLGRGWVFGLNTALDETGATIGPLLMALALSRSVPYRAAYAWLVVPAVCALAAVAAARFRFPGPAAQAARERLTASATDGFTPRFWLSMAGAAAFGAGLMSFEFISFHMAATGLFADAWIPIGVALATVASIVASLALGRLYDRAGLPVALWAMAVGALFSPFVFLGGFAAVLVGLVLWGVGYAVQDTLLKAIVAGMLPRGRRNFAFGIFFTGYGAGWLIGAVMTGLLYPRSHAGVVVFAVASQLLAIPLFLMAGRTRS